MNDGVRARILEKIALHPDWSNNKIASATRMNGRRVAHADDVAALRDGASVVSESHKSKASGSVTMESLVAKFDQVGEVLAKIKVLGNDFKYDEDMRKEVGIGDARWRRVRGSTRLAGMWYKMPDGALVWGQPARIKSLVARIKELA